MANLILDCETKGMSPFQFQPKHPQFEVLFAGFLINGKVYQLDTKEKILQILQTK